MNQGQFSTFIYIITIFVNVEATNLCLKEWQSMGAYTAVGNALIFFVTFQAFWPCTKMLPCINFRPPLVGRAQVKAQSGPDPSLSKTLHYIEML